MTSRTYAAHGSGEWTTDWVDDPVDFAAVAPEWDELHRRTPTATAFQRSAWLAAWWRSYGAGELRVLTVRRGGRLVGGAALMLERRRGTRVLSPVGRGLSDITELLATPLGEGGEVDEVVRELAEALHAATGWDVLDLPEIRPEGVADRLARCWAGRCWRTPASVCLQLSGRPFDDLLLELPSKTRGTIRRKVRIIDGAGLAARTAAAHEIADAIETLLRLHELQWRGRGGNPEHLTPRFAALLRTAVSELAHSGEARVELYTLDGRVQAADLLLVDRSSVGAYLVGVDPQLRDRVDVATLLVRHNLAITAALGRQRLDLMRGEEDYKARWRPARVEQERVLLARSSGPAAAAYVSLIRGRAAARAWLVERPQLRAAVTAALRAGRQDGPLGALGSVARTLRNARR
jgi:CelD/BcsL family acetyltransferase involved in cellulose biosynthesis